MIIQEELKSIFSANIGPDEQSSQYSLLTALDKYLIMRYP